MKTLKLVFILSILIFVIAACQKEEVDTVVTDSNIGYAKVGDNDLNLRFMWIVVNCDDILWGGPCDIIPIGCTWPPVDCLPTVVIRGEASRQDLNDLLDHIERGTYDDFFRTNQFARTFGTVRNFPQLHTALIGNEADFVIESDSLDNYLYLIGFDKNVPPSERTENDIIVAFEIDQQ